MDVSSLKQGMKVELDNGATVEVLEAPGAERSVKVRYIDSPLWPVEPGTEEVVSADSIYGVYQGEGVIR